MPKILIVDDELNIRELVKKYAVFENFESDTATNGIEAIEMCKHNEYDLVIMDIKALEKDKYKEITGYNNIDISLNFLDECQKQNKKMWLRQVIIPGVNDNEEYILSLKEFISKLKNIEKVELLPYHTYGVSKYKKLNIPYKLGDTKDMDIKKCQELEKLLLK